MLSPRLVLDVYIELYQVESLTRLAICPLFQIKNPLLWLMNCPVDNTASNNIRVDYRDCAENDQALIPRCFLVFLALCKALRKDSFGWRSPDFCSPCYKHPAWLSQAFCIDYKLSYTVLVKISKSRKYNFSRSSTVNQFLSLNSNLCWPDCFQSVIWRSRNCWKWWNELAVDIAKAQEQA